MLINLSSILPVKPGFRAFFKLLPAHVAVIGLAA